MVVLLPVAASFAIERTQVVILFDLSKAPSTVHKAEGALVEPIDAVRGAAEIGVATACDCAGGF